MGKGELDPEMIMVFESESAFVRDIDRIIKLRNLIKNEFKLQRLYHTFMVRCQPKACTIRQNFSDYGDTRFLDKEHNCLLNNQKCQGIPIRSNNEEILACLPFLIEELEILKPHYLILFGERVGNFVLKSFGYFEPVKLGQIYKNDGMQFMVAPVEEDFQADDCHKLLPLVVS